MNCIDLKKIVLFIAVNVIGCKEGNSVKEALVEEIEYMMG